MGSLYFTGYPSEAIATSIRSRTRKQAGVSIRACFSAHKDASYSIAIMPPLEAMYVLPLVVLPQQLALSLSVKSARRGTGRCGEPNKRAQHRRRERPESACSGPSDSPVTGPSYEGKERMHPWCLCSTDTKATDADDAQ